MRGEEKDKNIFETASKQLGKGAKPPEKTEKKPPPPLTAAPPAPNTPYRDPEVNDMMRQIKEMNDDLNRQMENISKKSGVSYDDLKKLIGSPGQPANVEMVKKGDVLRKKIEGVVPTIAPRLAAPQKTEKQLEGERKGKTLGARKKWIPMH